MKNPILTLLIIFITFSCARLPKKELAPVPKPELILPTILQVDAFNGFAKKVLIILDQQIEVENIVCLGKNVGFDHTDDGLRVFISVPYKFTEKMYTCQLLSKNYAPRDIFTVNVKDYPYKAEFLKVPKKHIDLAPEDVKRWQGEVAALKKVYDASILKRALFTEEFARPLGSKITSSYGKRRVFNDKKDSWHSGVDFRARVPTKIPAANRGKIAFVGELFFNGNTVIIDHGLGIFTMYCHLSKITSVVGEIVPKGAIVGISGNTGRSNAPHLHWGVKVSENWINGLSLINQGI
jgi:hypothetical protein